jgi:WD40 repeat protein
MPCAKSPSLARAIALVTLPAILCALSGAISAIWVSGCDPCPACPSSAVISPTAAHFMTTGSMTDSRIFHTATLLDTGQVLVAGGSQIPGTLDAAEIYDPSNGSFTATAGAMTQPRHHHTSTVLNNGMVLIAGGDNGGGLLTATAFVSAELYNPATNNFSATGSMFAPRTWHTATILNDGKVLVAGGSPAVDSTIDTITGSGTGLPIGALPNAELFTVSNGEFTGNPGSMNAARTEHTASLIKGCSCSLEGQVLLAGGIDESGTTLTSAEVFDEATGAFTVTGSMNVARHNHTATTLSDGRVLITGGVDNALDVLSSAEIYDPNTQVFTLTSPMTRTRAFHSAQLLSDGRVLIVGGSGDNTAEIFDPATEEFTATSGPMTVISYVQTATAISSGVLVAGGGLLLNAVGVLIPNSSLNSGETFSASSETFTATPQTMVHSRAAASASMLNDGRVLITGGEDLTRRIYDTSELYDPTAGTFSCVNGATGRSCTSSLHDVRFSQTATPLAGSAQVLIAAGSDGSSVETSTGSILAGIATAEIYNAASKTYSCVGGVSSTPPLCNNSMVDGRYNHIAVTLANGQVLFAGGIDSTGTVTNSAELYDPSSGKFTATGSMTTTRQELAGALFTSGPLAGQVLITGGADARGNFLSSAELYNPSTGAFTATAPMAESRFLHSETLLSSGPNAGDMLVAAGSGDQTAELFDPATQTFKPAGNMTQIVFVPVVNTLSSGSILVAGGATFNSEGQIVPISAAELYDPTSNQFTDADSMTTARFETASAFLNPSFVSGSESGNVLIAGGEGINSTLASSELFVPASSSASTAMAELAPAAPTGSPALSPAAGQHVIAQGIGALQGQLAGTSASSR